MPGPPRAVVVGSDAAALHVAGRLAAEGGFDVTLLEATQVIGGQWLSQLHSERSDFTGWEDGIFLDFPMSSGFPHSVDGGSSAVSPRSNTSELSPRGGGGAAAAVVHVRTEADILRHLETYAKAVGVHRCVRLGCTLRRAKWQAMNMCWRLEVREEARGNKQRGQLSADLLVVSKVAVATPRLPHVPGRELYSGTVLTANDHLTGEGGAVVLDQQLTGRSVLVVGPPGAASATWAELCRKHAGAGGAVLLLEVVTDPRFADTAVALSVASKVERTNTPEPKAVARVASTAAAAGSASGRASTGAPPAGGVARPSLLARLFSCFRCAREEPALSPHESDGLQRYSPAHAGAVEEPGEAQDDDEGGDGKTAGCSPSRVLSMEALSGADMGGDHGGILVGKQDASVRGGNANGGCGGWGGNESGVWGQDAALKGRSSLRVLRGVGALLNGKHVTLSTGEELPADVVLLVPLGGYEPDMSFLDQALPHRLSAAGSSLAGGNGFRGGSFRAGSFRAGGGGGGSFRRAMSNLSVASFSSMPEGLSEQVDELYRDIASSSPGAPNLALVGLSAHAAHHDARTAAAQARWLLSTWVPAGARAGSISGRGGGASGSECTGEHGAGERGSEGAGFLRQATPMDANADSAQRAKWRDEAAKRGQMDFYKTQYLRCLLQDLGLIPASRRAVQFFGNGSASTQTLTRGRVARLLGLRRVPPPLPSREDSMCADERGQSPRGSAHDPHSRMHSHSTAGGGYGVERDSPSADHFGDHMAPWRTSNPNGNMSYTRSASRTSAPVGRERSATRSVADGPQRSDISASYAPGGLGGTASPSRSYTQQGGGLDQALYALEEHPREQRTSGAGWARQGSHGARRGSMPSCPSSPGSSAAALLLAAAAAGDNSRSGSPRSRIMSAGGGGLGTGMGGGGGSGAASPFHSGAMLSAAASGPVGAGFPTSGGGSPALQYGSQLDDPSAASSHMRSQLLARHRSTSRLAGVSHATTALPPSLATPNGAAAVLAAAISFGRRSSALSSSQVPAQLESSHSAILAGDRRSQNGRTSQTRRTLGPGGYGGPSPSAQGRVHSAARLNLLVAAANSASRRRNLMYSVGAASCAATGSNSPETRAADGGSRSIMAAYGDAVLGLEGSMEGGSSYGAHMPGRQGSSVGNVVSVNVFAPHSHARVGTGLGGAATDPIVCDIELGASSPPVSPGIAPLPPGKPLAGAGGDGGGDAAAVSSGDGDGERRGPARPSGALHSSTALSSTALAAPAGSGGIAEPGAAPDASSSQLSNAAGASSGLSDGRRRAHRRRSITLPDLRTGLTHHSTHLNLIMQHPLDDDEEDAAIAYAHAAQHHQQQRYYAAGTHGEAPRGTTDRGAYDMLVQHSPGWHMPAPTGAGAAEVAAVDDVGFAGESGAKLTQL